ncbi:MAG: hypothetical protein R3C18_10210 [Planctomycetaceae bacterium]
MNASGSSHGQHREVERTGLSRGWLAVEVICASVMASVIATVYQAMIWNHQEELKGTLQQYHWLPVDDLPAMLMLMPFGFVIYSLFPPGWLFWIGFYLTLRLRSRWFILISISGAVLFGVFWPKHLVGMLGI